MIDTTDGTPILIKVYDKVYIDQKRTITKLASQNLLLQKQTKLELSSV